MKPLKTSVLIIFLVLIGSCKGSKHTTGEKLSDADVALRKKYAGLVSVEEKEITNLKLYRFVDDWYAAPYKYAGKTKSGVDCSGFTTNLLRDVYEITLAGSANSMYEACESVSEKNLQQGDLVFFKINSDKVSHVGVYLQNRRFVHASSSRGVVISCLDEAYYTKYFFKGGRPKTTAKQ
jgi:lipoprotein Spr